MAQGLPPRGWSVKASTCIKGKVGIVAVFRPFYGLKFDCRSLVSAAGAPDKFPQRPPSPRLRRRPRLPSCLSCCSVVCGFLGGRLSISCLYFFNMHGDSQMYYLQLRCANCMEIAFNVLSPADTVCAEGASNDVFSYSNVLCHKICRSRLLLTLAK
jgi:hypothetical protein